jgi:hypothetical protein
MCHFCEHKVDILVKKLNYCLAFLVDQKVYALSDLHKGNIGLRLAKSSAQAVVSLLSPVRHAIIIYQSCPRRQNLYGRKE